MDGTTCAFLQGLQVIDALTDDIEQSALDLVTGGNADGTAQGLDLRAALQAVGTVHSDTAHGVFSHVLLHLQNEFAAIKNDNAQITIFFENKDGIIDIAKIQELNGNDSSYFISGPPAMIKIFKEKLIELGVPKENVLTDDWE